MKSSIRDMPHLWFLVRNMEKIRHRMIIKYCATIILKGIRTILCSREYRSTCNAKSTNLTLHWQTRV